MFLLGRCFNSCVSRAQTRSVDRFKVDTEPADRKQRQLFPKEVWINSRGHHRAEYHVAARPGKAVEVKSLHEICMRIDGIKLVLSGLLARAPAYRINRS